MKRMQSAKGSRAPTNPLHQRAMFTEKDLFKANNLYTLMDKSQHIFANKMFAQSSINQVKLEKDSKKYREMLYGADNDEDD